MTVQAVHLVGSNAKCVLPRDCHEGNKKFFANFEHSDKHFAEHIMGNHGISIVDESICARPGVLCAQAGSNWCQQSRPRVALMKSTGIPV